MASTSRGGRPQACFLVPGSTAARISPRAAGRDTTRWKGPCVALCRPLAKQRVLAFVKVIHLGGTVHEAASPRPGTVSSSTRGRPLSRSPPSPLRIGTTRAPAPRKFGRRPRIARCRSLSCALSHLRCHALANGDFSPLLAPSPLALTLAHNLQRGIVYLLKRRSTSVSHCSSASRFAAGHLRDAPAGACVLECSRSYRYVCVVQLWLLFCSPLPALERARLPALRRTSFPSRVPVSRAEGGYALLCYLLVGSLPPTGL